jgi:hypothetical protein
MAGDRHGGAPKGERVARGFARRDPRVTARPTLALAGATTITKRRLSALRPPFDSVGTKPRCKTRTQKCGRGNEMGCLTS